MNALIFGKVVGGMFKNVAVVGSLPVVRGADM
jgi:hypothetical protein